MMQRLYKFFFFSIIFLGYVLISNAQQQESYFFQRNGLPNFFNKLKKGKPVSIAYFGGSITEAQNGWREKTLSYFKEQYPKADIKEIFAAIGGTASDFGAFRVKDHVLKYKPDMVFIEFSTNDAGREKNDIEKSMEGIVRQIWKCNPHTDICIIHTVTKYSLPDYEKGSISESAAAIEAVADYYKIPSINLGPTVANKIRRKEFVIDTANGYTPPAKIFSIDGVHPIKAGHELYFDIIKDCLQKLSGKAGKLKHKIRKVRTPSFYENTKMLSLDDAAIKKTGNWKRWKTEELFNNKTLGLFTPIVYQTDDAAATATFSFTGTVVGVSDFKCPASATMRITIDGKVTDKDRFDGFCTYNRINYFIIKDLVPGKHQVTISVSPVKPDKRKILKEGVFKVKDEDFKKPHLKGVDTYNIFPAYILYAK